MGVDLSAAAIDEARKRYPQVSFEIMNLIEWVPPAGTFDFVFMVDSLEHVPDAKLALFRVAQMLKRDGVFVVSVPIVRDANAKSLFEFEYAYPEHVYYFTRTGIKQVLEEAGFVIESADESKRDKLLVGCKIRRM
jgi:2-polyprenyl-3-methyl-5-hydroxy-6-metoxy-1,4-benzoquinol methylase